MIASDLNNPEFAGAISNPDARLHVTFYSKPVENAFKSKQEQRPIFDQMDFVRIQIPGDKMNIIDTFVREDHKQRFPIQWAAYQNRKAESGEGQITGTPITQWPRITSAMAEELKALKFYTVESIAGASDAQLQGIGMIAGQSVFAFRDDAKRFLMTAEAAKKLAEADEKMKAANEEFARKEAEWKERFDLMQKQMAQLLDSAAETTAKGKPGRKPKAEQEVGGE